MAHKRNFNGEKRLESKIDLNAHANQSRLRVEGLCTIKNRFKIYKKRNVLPQNFNYKVGAMLTGQMINAER